MMADQAERPGIGFVLNFERIARPAYSSHPLATDKGRQPRPRDWGRSDMDLHATVPSSSDEGFDLDMDLPGPELEFAVDPEAIGTEEVANHPALEAAQAAHSMAIVSVPAIDGEPASPAEAEVMTTTIESAPAENPSTEAESAETADPSAKAGASPKLRRKKKVAKKRWDAPAWVVSTLIHIAVVGGLAAVATGSGEVAKRLANLDTTLVANPGTAEELTKIYADPADIPRDQAVGDTKSSTAGQGVGFASIGTAPSNTPAVSQTGRQVNEKSALPTIASISVPSGLTSTTRMLNRDLGGGGMIGGDVTYGAGDVGVALDQIAREILRHLTQHKVTVVWLFDESESMKDDQKAIREKFDRVVNELKVNAPDEVPTKGKKAKSSGPPLNHAIVGFGNDLHFNQEKPTTDIEAIGKAIDRLQIDSTGKENTMQAVRNVIGHYRNLISNERKLLIVLVTDESGDDGEYIEEARQAAVSGEVPIYIIGRQSLFGTGNLTIGYTDPVTKDFFWVGIRRGPETADVEALQYDGIHRRWDEVPSGFAPYELARLAKDTGGIYFLLPSEEGLRIKTREKAYSMETLKEYVPDYESRPAYLERREKSELRRTLFAIIQETNAYPFRHHFPVNPDQLLPAIQEELPKTTLRLNALIKIEERLRQLEKLRNRETEKRWQAAYDLMLAQVVAYQLKAYEYRANLLEMAAKPPKPNTMPTPELFVEWSLDHSTERKAPKEKTEKVYLEATRLLQLVVERHPNTPWGDLALDTLNRGLGVKRSEWHHKHSTRYEERAKLVPKF
jgi:hypothetical protein